MAYYHSWRVVEPNYIGITTFKCDGCGKRFCKEQIWVYGKYSKLHQLDEGVFANSSQIIYTLTCSKKCSANLPKRTVNDLRRYLGEPVAKPGYVSS